jgi:nucleotide-binding universal stress UspA family protein
MRKPDNVPESGPVIVGADGSERSVEALALADLLGPALGRPVVIAYVHPYGKLASLFSECEYETLVREVAESTFDQIREHLPSVAERRMQLVSEESPAAGLHALAEREAAALMVLGSSHRSRIAAASSSAAPARVCFLERRRPSRSPRRATLPAAAAGSRWWAVGSTARRSRSGRSLGRPISRARRRPGYAC